MDPKIASDLDRIHENTIRILSEIGMSFHCEEALGILKNGGICVRDGRAFFTAEQVENAIKLAPKEFTVFARNEDHNVTINTENLYVTPGYGSACICETDGTLRESVLDDFLNFAAIVQQSDAFDINGGILAQPCDIDASIAAPVMVYSALKRSDKVLLSVSANAKLTQNIMDILCIAFGEEDLIKTPRAFTLISTMSPLSIDRNAVETVQVCAKYHQPLVIAPGPMAGGTGPISLSGNVSLANAEILGLNVLAQMLSPGLPIIYGFAATTSDMRTMGVCNASAGFVKESRYGALMAKRYGFACRSGGAMSDAGGLTAQAGVESAMSLFESFSEKANFVMHAAGSLHSFASASYEKFILDIETIDRMRYYFSDLSTDEDALAFSVIQDIVKKNDQFMLHDHTLGRCRIDPWKPQVSQHGRSKGDPNEELYAAIRVRLNSLLNGYKKPYMDPDVERRLDEYMLKLGMHKEDIAKV